MPRGVREDLGNCTGGNCPSVQETAEKTMRVTYAYTGVLILRAYVHFFHYCPVIYVLFAVSCVQKGMYKKPFILCAHSYLAKTFLMLRFAQCYCGSAIIYRNAIMHFSFFSGHHSSGSSPKAGWVSVPIGPFHFPAN